MGGHRRADVERLARREFLFGLGERLRRRQRSVGGHCRALDRGGAASCGELPHLVGQRLQIRVGHPAPRHHRRTRHAAAQRLHEVVVGRHAVVGADQLEQAEAERVRARPQQFCDHRVTVAVGAVADGAVARVELGAAATFAGGRGGRGWAGRAGGDEESGGDQPGWPCQRVEVHMPKVRARRAVRRCERRPVRPGHSAGAWQPAVPREVNRRGSPMAAPGRRGS